MSETASASTGPSSGSWLDLIASAALAGTVALFADVAFELWLQGTQPDVLTSAVLPAGVTFALVAAATLCLALLLTLLPWPALSRRDAAALGALDVLGAFLAMSWFASRDFGGAWMSTRVVLTVGVLVGAALLVTGLLLVERRRSLRLGSLLQPAVLAMAAGIGLGAGAVGIGLSGVPFVLGVVGALLLVASGAGALWKPALRSPLLLVGCAVVASLLAWFALRLAAPGAPKAAGGVPGPKLVLLLSVDTLRADFSGLSPGDLPNLTALESESVVFENAISASGWTVPAFASILTGLPPEAHQTGLSIDTLPSTLPTLGEELQKVGYRTLAIGKNPFLRPYRGLDRGFGSYIFYPRNVLETSVGSRLLRGNQAENPLADISTDGIADAGIEVIESLGDQPTFLWLHFFDPHLPYAPPERFIGDSMAVDVIGRRFDKLRQQRGGYFVPDADQKYAIEELYKAEIRWVDEAIGRVVSALREQGLWDETLLVLTSDHGEEFWEHGGFEHGHTLYNELLHVPLIVKPAATTTGVAQRVSQRVATASVFSTVRDLVGVQGELPFAVSPSLVPHLGDSPGAEADAPGETSGLAFSTGTKYYEDLSTVQFERFKYIVSETGQEWLFDLGSDSGELNALGLNDEELLLRAREILGLQQDGAAALFDAVSGSSEERELDAQTLRRLKSLGYVQ